MTNHHMERDGREYLVHSALFGSGAPKTFNFCFYYAALTVQTPDTADVQVLQQPVVSQVKVLWYSLQR